MKVAIIGGGISGLMAADHLNGLVDYTLYEAADKLGGHADTHLVHVDGQEIQVDTGFIVFNEDVYHHFNDMLNRYQVPSIKSDMSFAVSNKVTGLEYNATSLRTLFCQKKNVFNPRFYRMIWDIKRFYGQAESLLNSGTETGVYDYLKKHRYSDMFIDEHIMPMISALWSGDFETVKDYPLVYMLQFMKNHQMLQLNNRPEWRTIRGGSRTYVQAIEQRMTGQVRLAEPVINVNRNNAGVVVETAEQSDTFDWVIFATHSDVTLQLLQQPTADEQAALTAIPYVENHMDLHTDERLLPANKNAWASWSVNKHLVSKPVCTVNYYMNLLQSLPTSTPVIVSLNQHEYINNSQILLSRTYHHPVYNRNTLQAQQQIDALQGQHRTLYCGAYLGWGFHEDGARSGVAAAEKLQELL
jgi:predicted NAD/FAD-binding protein